MSNAINSRGGFSVLVLSSRRVAEKEPVNKMSLHNLATVFGPTLLRPSEAESSKPHITLASDIWSHDVMAQVNKQTKTTVRPSPPKRV